MNAMLNTWAQRINSLTLRERLFLFLTLSSGLLALADQAVISPCLDQESRWRIADQQTSQALGTLRVELARLNADASSPDSSLNRLQHEVAQLEAQRQALQQTSGQAGTGHAPDTVALPKLLDEVLRRHSRVNLLQLASAPAQAADAASTATTSSSAEPLSTVLVVAGRYADLLAFVQELEQRLPTLRWGELLLQAGDTTPVLRVQLWLERGATS